MKVNKIVLPNSVMLGEVKSLLAEGRDVIIPTKGNSMLPFIRGERDSVNLRKLQDISVGDIVLAEIREGCYVLHRVFELDGDRVTLMGDGNLRGVERCTRAQIAGTAIEILRNGEKTVDCRSPKAVRQARVWRRLMPFRRIILGFYRRLFL